MIVLLGVASVSASEPSERLRHRVLHAVVRCVERRAYVDGVDFDEASERLSLRHTALSGPMTDVAFAAALNDVLRPIGVSHLMLFSPTETLARRSGQDLWAGLKLLPDGDGLVVSMIAAGGPAELAGLQRRDRVVAVDGEAVHHGGVAGVRAGKLRQGVAPLRRVRWEREGVTHEADVGFDLVATGTTPSLRWEEGLAWLTIDSFRYGAYDRSVVDAAFAEILARPADALLLDLRSNAGGLSLHSDHLLTKLVPPGPALTLTRSSRHEVVHTEVNLGAEGPRYTGPVIVLVDSLSASGGELVPAVLRERIDATIIGMPTAGALLHGEQRELPGGYLLLFPTSDVRTTGGVRLEGVGLQPDILLDAQQIVDDEQVRDLVYGRLGAGVGGD